MSKTLIAFGCSFTYGDELLDPNLKPGEPSHSKYNDAYRNSHCYAGIIAEHYGLNFVNTAIPGGSLESTRYALYHVLQNYQIEDLVFIVGLTNSIRQSWFDPDSDSTFNKFQHSSAIGWPHPPVTEWEKLNHQWYKMCHCPAWEKYNLGQTVSYFDSTGVPTVHIPVFKNEPSFNSKNHCGFVLTKIVPKDHYHKNGHPDEVGHRLVANRLIKYIDSVKLF